MAILDHFDPLLPLKWLFWAILESFSPYFGPFGAIFLAGAPSQGDSKHPGRPFAGRQASPTHHSGAEGTRGWGRGLILHIFGTPMPILDLFQPISPWKWSFLTVLGPFCLENTYFLDIFCHFWPHKWLFVAPFSHFVASKCLFGTSFTCLGHVAVFLAFFAPNWHILGRVCTQNGCFGGFGGFGGPQNSAKSFFRPLQGTLW